jgi:hypothetical protein
MDLTDTESTVIQHLRGRRVATMLELRQPLDLSHMTVARALRKAGYYSSYNFNSAYYTLRQTPAFDAHGLWKYRRIGFSRHGTLGTTLEVLVEQSAAGYTVEELEQRLGAKVANLSSALARRDRLGQMRSGHRVIYLARDPQVQARQRAAREQSLAATARPQLAPRRRLPPGYEARAVIELLLELVQTPQASDASLSQALQARGVPLTAEQVRRVKEFYALQKKRHAGRGRPPA